ncbi:MAG: hypothetical protein IJT87_02140 [Ruminiclostridium sp.]|nr:hypothetical protein [Ruminiclostridium sp.]
MPREKNLKENKTKNLISSLIFPVICAVGVIVYLLFNFNYLLSLQKPIAVVMAGCAIFPLISVIFLKTDISGMIKWQIISTAAAAVSYLFFLLLVGVGEITAKMFTFNIFAWVGVFFFGVFVPALLILACGVIYAVKVCKESGRRLLKWFTVFFSTPAVYYGACILSTILTILIMYLYSFAFAH